MTPMPQPPPSNPRREEGSAYIVTLLVLAILSIVGLSLVVITQTESQIGSTERVINETFYAAESGLAASLARAMNGAYDPFEFELGEDIGLVSRTNNVRVGTFFPVRLGFCNLCSANLGSEYHLVHYLVQSEGTRQGIAPDDTRHPLAQQAMSVTISIQPTEGPLPGPTFDRAGAQRVSDVENGQGIGAVFTSN